MARFSRLKVCTTMIETGVTPVFYTHEVEKAIRIVAACADGGARCIEFTNRGDQAALVFAELVRHFQKDERVILGVGSVIEPVAAGLFIQMGANFVVGPVLNAETARVCNRYKVAYMPGCGSASEISQAEELGVEICKVFPGAEVGGPAFVKAVSGPMPWTRIMPTGGVSPDEANLRAWFTAGVACVGIGSNLITKEIIAQGDYATLTENVRRVIELIRQIRQGKDPI